jgi:RNA polymerase sigma-70 factor (ECF subfamily)
MADIQQQIEAEIPALRRYARALVRDAMGADDLVQDCLTRALAKLHLWSEGTDLRAWLFTILHNQYVNHVRRSIRTGPTVEFGETDSTCCQLANQEASLELRDLDRALGQLAAEHRAVILVIGLEGMSYNEVSAVLDIPVGTVRSRVSRGRQTLRHLMGFKPRRRNRPETRPRASRREALCLPARTERSVAAAAAGLAVAGLRASPPPR